MRPAPLMQPTVAPSASISRLHCMRPAETAQLDAEGGSAPVRRRRRRRSPSAGSAANFGAQRGWAASLAASCVSRILIIPVAPSAFAVIIIALSVNALNVGRAGREREWKLGM